MIKKTFTKRLLPLIILIILLGFAVYWTSKSKQEAKIAPARDDGIAAQQTENLNSESNTNSSRLQVPQNEDKASAGQQLDVTKTQEQSETGANTKALTSGQIARLVVAQPVGVAVVNDRFSAIGTGRALNTVSLTPWSDGTLQTLFVRAGTKVNIGDAVAKLDSDKEEITVEKAKVQMHDAELALARIEKLRATNTASEVQEITAKLNLENAKLALRDGELALDRRTVRSPINGIVGILPVDPGNFVTTNTPIARIDDRSKILIDIWVAERFAPFIHIGDQVAATSIARPDKIFSGKISAIDNMIDEKSRTLRVRAEIANDEDSLRAGMSFEVKLRFPGDALPTVDPLAIQWRDTGAYIWKIENYHVKRVAISIIQRNTDSVLVSGPLHEHDLVVVQGLQNLQENSLVKLQNEPELENNQSNAAADHSTQVKGEMR